MPLFNLALRNFILVREAYLEFCPGFNVLTGETGAGKSMLLGALKLIAGTDVDWEVLRGEEDEIELSDDEFEHAYFSSEQVEHAGFDRAVDGEVEDYHLAGLPEPVDAPYTLFDAHWVPR